MTGKIIPAQPDQTDYQRLIASFDPVYHPHVPLFSKIINMSQRLGAALPPNVYTLSAMRLDPCFNIIETKGDDTKCIAQMRLLWQPFVGDGVIVDQSVHEIFRLERSEFVDALNTIVALRQGADADYDQKQLQPHPIMVAQGPNGAYFKGIKALIKRFAKQQNLMGAAGIIRTEDDKPRLRNMAVVTMQDGKLAPIAPLATIRKNNAGEAPYAQTFQDSDILTALGGFPSGLSPDAFATEMRAQFNMFPPPTDAERKPQLNGSLAELNRVNDPAVHDIFDMDCSSCHQSTEVAKSLKGQGATADNESPLYRSDWQFDNKIGEAYLGNVPKVLQMFSYRMNILSGGSKIYPVIQTGRSPKPPRWRTTPTSIIWAVSDLGCAPCRRSPPNLAAILAASGSTAINFNAANDSPCLGAALDIATHLRLYAQADETSTASASRLA